MTLSLKFFNYKQPIRKGEKGKVKKIKKYEGLTWKDEGHFFFGFKILISSHA